MKKNFIIGLVAIMSIVFLSSFAIATTQNGTGAGPGHSNGNGGTPDQGGNMGNDKPVGNASPKDTDCEDDSCKSKGNLQGTFDQSTGAWKVKGKHTVDGDTITVENGAFASASENGGGAYFGKYKGDGWGLGGAASIGGSLAHAQNDKNMALAGAVAGNISAAGVGGDLDKQCANIYGDANHMTLAVKSGKMGLAYGTTSGQFTYGAQTGSGLVVGGGLTGGVSAAYMDGNTAGAIAGGATVSGVGNINMGGNID